MRILSNRELNIHFAADKRKGTIIQTNRGDGYLENEGSREGVVPPVLVLEGTPNKADKARFAKMEKEMKIKVIWAGARPPKYDKDGKIIKPKATNTWCCNWVYMEFAKWLVKCTEGIRKERGNRCKCILYADNHSPHHNPKIREYLKENGIYCVDLPPNTTDRMQPVDMEVGAFYKQKIQKAFRGIRDRQARHLASKRRVPYIGLPEMRVKVANIMIKAFWRDLMGKDVKGKMNPSNLMKRSWDAGGFFLKVDGSEDGEYKKRVMEELRIPSHFDDENDSSDSNSSGPSESMELDDFMVFGEAEGLTSFPTVNATSPLANLPLKLQGAGALTLRNAADGSCFQETFTQGMSIYFHRNSKKAAWRGILYQFIQNVRNNPTIADPAIVNEIELNLIGGGDPELILNETEFGNNIFDIFISLISQFLDINVALYDRHGDLMVHFYKHGFDWKNDRVWMAVQRCGDHFVLIVPFGTKYNKNELRIREKFAFEYPRGVAPVNREENPRKRKRSEISGFLELSSGDESAEETLVEDMGPFKKKQRIGDKRKRNSKGKGKGKGKGKRKEKGGKKQVSLFRYLKNN